MRPTCPWILVALLACSPERPDGEAAGGVEAPVSATGAFVYAPLTAAQASGYLVLHNPTAEVDTLVTVTVDWAAQASIHETTEAGGMVRMHHLDRLVLPARDSVVLAPGGIHLMFMDLTRMPVAGDTVSLALQLARGGTLLVPAVVRPYGQ